MSQNPIQDKVNELVAERTSIYTELKKMDKQYENYNIRLAEINGSINTLVELFSASGKENIQDEVEVTRHDSEIEVASGTDTDKE